MMLADRIHLEKQRWITLEKSNDGTGTDTPLITHKAWLTPSKMQIVQE
jgi:hypothetical protein